MPKRSERAKADVALIVADGVGVERLASRLRPVTECSDEALRLSDTVRRSSEFCAGEEDRDLVVVGKSCAKAIDSSELSFTGIRLLSLTIR
eukprot:5059267-Pleurochrysis_carterae.AAC.2